RQLVVHHADVPDDQRDFFEGIAVTTVSRTLRDCHAAHLGAELLNGALRDAEQQGLLRRKEADQLRMELELGAP
ncbi:MAG TPA: hypothetical protein VK399_17270, partial [Longimicrobiaceae bacterium]|nr:hypothetical protein [Longimicrobiaceae bacterium]